MTTILKIAINAAIEAGKKVLEVYSDPNSDFMIERKSDNSPLTIADKISHTIIYDLLYPLNTPILSEEGAMVEYDERSKWSELWVVDPLDGTKEFIKRNGEFTINIAKVIDGTPKLGVIYVPVTGELYYGEEGMGSFKCEQVYNIDDVDAMSKAMPTVVDRDNYVVVASRSHLSEETSEFITNIENKIGSKIDIISKGSSLKMCLIAEGKADIYPRFAPTMEWDTAAGDAILRSMGLIMVDAYSEKPLVYNKPNLLNPFFIAR